MAFMKILQVNKFYYPHTGGIEKVVQDIAEGLRDNVDMEVLVCKAKGLGSKEKVNGVSVVRAGSVGIYFSMPLSPFFPIHLKQHSKGKDIIHLHMPFPLGDISYLLTRPKGKIVVSWHSDIIRQKRLLRLYSPFLKRFLQKADKIIVATPAHIESSIFLKEFRDKCKVIPFGVNIERFSLNERIKERMLEIRNRFGKPIVLFVGRLIYYKGVEYLVKAMKEVDAILLLVGGGALRDRLVSLAARLGISDKVIFLGNVDDDELISCYHACDVFVLPSVANSEAFGLVQIEAMACGKPVVSTDLPTGASFVNVHGVTGIVVPIKNEFYLRDAINMLIHDSDMRKEYGENSRKRVEKEFTRDKMIDSILNLYRELLIA